MIWTTPQPIFDALNKKFNFTIDLCADEGNAKCEKWIARESSLSSSWDGVGTGWLNPPYGREISMWTKKALESDRAIVGFLPGRTNAPWWHDHVMKAIEIWFVRRKVSFANPDGWKGVPPWGAVVVLWSPNWHGLFPRLCQSWDYRKVQI